MAPLVLYSMKVSHNITRMLCGSSALCGRGVVSCQPPSFSRSAHHQQAQTRNRGDRFSYPYSPAQEWLACLFSLFNVREDLSQQ